MKLIQYCIKYHFWTFISILSIVIIFLYFWRWNKKGSWTPFSITKDFYKIVNHKKIYKKHPYLNRQHSGFRFKKKHKDSKGERMCRRVLENIFKKPFPKERPDFLRNNALNNNMNLELDCYNPELRLGVEYNGRQHYEFIPFFHKNKEAFHNQKYRDYMKKNMCKKNGIHLISVPYTVKIKDIPQFLIQKIKQKGYKI